MMRGLMVAIVTVVVADLAMLAGVRVDRSSDDIVFVTLDERELRLERPEDGSSTLRLRFEGVDVGPHWTTGDQLRRTGWIGPETLAALGFDLSIPAGDARAAQHYQSALSRPAVVAFDVGTDAWDRRLAEWRERRRAQDVIAGGVVRQGEPEASIADVAAGASRLVPIDVASDAAALRGKYRHRAATLVLPVVVALRFDRGERVHSRTEVLGAVTEVLPRAIVVPARFLPVVKALETTTAPPPRADVPGVLAHAPRYDVTIAIGPALRPWIVDLRPLHRSAPMR